MLMDNTLELLGITDSNIKITRFSAESVNGEKRNVIEARLTYNVDRCPYCESECDRHRQNLSLFAFKRHQNNWN